MCAGVLVLLAACGLTGAPSTDPGPALAPWRDLGAVMVCRGETAFAPPASPPGGLCVRATSETVACERDAECGERSGAHVDGHAEEFARGDLRLGERLGGEAEEDLGVLELRGARARGENPAAEIFVVLNWFEELKQRVPIK